MSKFTDDLSTLAGAQWDRVINHRFTKEIAAGTIDRKASVIANARSLDDRIPGCQFLAFITSSENTYFDHLPRELLEENNDRVILSGDIPTHGCTSGFIKLMTDVARQGSLGNVSCAFMLRMVIPLLGNKRSESKTKRDDFVTYEWVDLHSGDFFEGVVTYIKELLDREAEFMDEGEKTKCRLRFVEAVQLEELLFKNAYNL